MTATRHIRHDRQLLAHPSRSQFAFRRYYRAWLCETAQRPHATVGFDAEFERYAIHDRAGGFHGFRKTLNEAIDLADAIQPPPPPRVKPKPAPEFEKRSVRSPPIGRLPPKSIGQSASRKAASAASASPNAGEAGFAIADRWASASLGAINRRKWTRLHCAQSAIAPCQPANRLAVQREISPSIGCDGIRASGENDRPGTP